MKKSVLLLIILLGLSFYLKAQPGEVKKIAILETVDKEGNINNAIKLMLRANLSKAITNTPGYEAYDRTDIDAIMSEQSFQRTGMVSDDQIKKLGEMTGATYILVAEAAKVDATNLFITAKILNVETAKTEMTDNVLCTSTPPDIQHACESLAAKLLGLKIPEYTNKEVKPTPQTNNTGNYNTAPQQQGNYANNPQREVGQLITFNDGSRGVIFYVDASGHGLAVSIDQTSVAWEDAKGRKMHDIAEIMNEGSDCNTVLQAGLGAQNTAAITRCYDGVFPAANWCKSHGNGWYLPSAGELVYLFKEANKGQGSKGPISLILRNYSGKPLDGWYWSSNEAEKKEAWNISAGGRSSTEEKGEKDIQVRAVRQF